MELYSLVKPLGILTYLVLLTTLVSGFNRWKLKVHKGLAVTALLLATLHAVLVLIAQ